MRRALSLMAALLIAATAAIADDIDLDRDTLRGLRGVGIIVENSDPEAEADGLNQTTIQTDVELKLRQAGIKVLIGTEAFQAASGMPSLFITVTTLRGKATPLYAYCIEVALRQHVHLHRDLSIHSFATTWSTPGAVGMVGRDNLRMVRDNIKGMVDKFINAYLSVNPK